MIQLKPIIRRAQTHLKDTQHRYTELLGYAFLFLSKPEIRVPVDLSVTVTGRLARIPNWLQVSDVGIDRDGNFEPMLTNPAMLDLDGCGGPDESGTGNPDAFPVEAFTETDLALTDMRIISAGYHYPDAPANRSRYGYYKVFDHKGYVLLDSVAAATFPAIVLRGTMRYFRAGMPTMVPDLMDAALFWFMVMEGQKATGDPMFQISEKDYKKALMQYKQSVRDSSAADVIAAWAR